MILQPTRPPNCSPTATDVNQKMCVWLNLAFAVAARAGIVLPDDLSDPPTRTTDDPSNDSYETVILDTTKSR